MKALTLYQPWASTVALRMKQYETRSWWTNYRGPVAIHAGTNRRFKNAMSAYMGPRYEYPFGAIIAVATIEGVYTTDELYLQVSALERHMGDWKPGRYAWKMAKVLHLPEPIPAKGKQGLWTPDDNTVTHLEMVYAAHLAGERL